jgi:hypothetical protein
MHLSFTFMTEETKKPSVVGITWIIKFGGLGGKIDYVY